MNPDEDEDAFLYGDGAQQNAAPSGQSAPLAQNSVDQEMEQASEGEVEDNEEDDEEDESDSVFRL